VKQAIFAYVKHARMRSWNQPVLSNKGKVSCPRKPMIGLELTIDSHPPITSQKRYPLRHAAPYIQKNYSVKRKHTHPHVTTFKSKTQC